MPITRQVTLGAGATQIITTPTPFRQCMIQNNAANAVRVGDSNVSATRGANLLPASAGSINLGTFTAAAADDLSLYFLFGTATQVIDVIYIP